MEIITYNNIKVTYGCIYVFKNKLNGKCYVGQTVNPEKRYKAHLKAAQNGSQLHFPRALRKYGIDNFDYKVVWGQYMPIEYAKDNLNYWEKYYINVFDSYNNGYNMTAGGEGGNGHANKGKPSPNKGKKTGKLAWNAGKNWNNKTKATISASTKEGMNNLETKSKCSIGGKISGSKLWIHNDVEIKRCLPEELDFYISVGYKRGRKI